MWWLIIIGFVIFIIYQTIADHSERVQTRISAFGGMRGKYKIVIDYLVNEAGLNISKITKESVILCSVSSRWTLDYVGYNLEVRMICSLPLLGTVNKKWIFPDGYPQEKMIEEFNNYVEWLMQELKKSGESNAYEHIEY